MKIVSFSDYPVALRLYIVANNNPWGDEDSRHGTIRVLNHELARHRGSRLDVPGSRCLALEVKRGSPSVLIPE